MPMGEREMEKQKLLKNVKSLKSMSQMSMEEEGEGRQSKQQMLSGPMTSSLQSVALVPLEQADT